MATSISFDVLPVNTPTDNTWRPGAGGVLWRQAPTRSIWVDTIIQAGSIEWVPGIPNAGIPIIVGYVYGPTMVGQWQTVTVNYAGDGPDVGGPTPPGPSGECVRRAWLTYPDTGELVPLEDAERGWFCTELDLGWPDIRDVVNNRPDQDGIDDRTRYFGARAISAQIVVQSTARTIGRTLDDVSTQWAPFMVPSRRPELHYVLDTPEQPERFFRVRAAGYAWPLRGGTIREIGLQWVAADPIARDAVEQSATAWAGSTVTAGRTYNLTFPRVYPAGGMPPTAGAIYSAGDVDVLPFVRIFGPITAPQLTFVWGWAPIVYQRFWFKAGFQIDAGQWVDIDIANRTVVRNSDPARNVLTSTDWSISQWPELPPRTNVQMRLVGGGATSSTQAVATWRDGFLQ